MKPKDRIAYSAIADRPALKLPGGARMVVWCLMAVEEWDIERAMPRTVITPPAGGAPIPDIPNWGWHEYGNRVGFWRLLRIFDEAGVKPALAINGCVVEAYPAIVAAARERGWELLGHGYHQLNMQKVADEAADIARTSEAIRAFTGQRPRGWVGPGLTETWDTPDHLAADGYEYVLDWVLDDQPYVLRTKSGPLYGIPYTQEVNDVALILIQNHRAGEYADRAIDQFEQLYEDSAESARVMCFSLHPYVMGVPHRARHVRRLLEHITRRKDVLFWSPGQILDWYKSQQSVG